MVWAVCVIFRKKKKKKKRPHLPACTFVQCRAGLLRGREPPLYTPLLKLAARPVPEGLLFRFFSNLGYLGKALELIGRRRALAKADAPLPCERRTLA